MRRRKILVIDDEEIITKTFARLLEKQGFQVLAASHSKEAIAMVEDEDFDLMVCDIRMPDQNGVSTTRQIQEIRRNQNKSGIPVIFVTGYADENLEKEAESLKPVGYLFKPFDAFQLLDLIRGQFL